MANYNEVLAYVEKHKAVSIPELQKAFSADYLEIRRIVQKMVEGNTIELTEGVQYVFTPSKEKKEKTAKKGAQEDDDDDIDFSELRRSLEERRRMLIERMTKEMEDDEEEDEDEEEENTDEEDTDEEDTGTEDESFGVIDYDLDDEPFDPEIIMTAKGCREGVTIFRSDGDYHIGVSGLNLGETRVVFNILPDGDSIIISDGGMTLQSFAEHISLDDPEVQETIVNVTGYYEDIDVSDNELRIAVDDYENSISCMMRLFVAMDIIYRIVGSICKERQESAAPPDPLCLNVLARLVKSRNASTSYIQRKFRIGYNRAVRIRDWMEHMGYVSSSNGGREKCKVLLSEEGFVKIYGHVGE